MLSEGLQVAVVGGVFGIGNIVYTTYGQKRSDRARAAEDARKEAATAETARGEQNIERQRILDAATTKAQEVYENLLTAVRTQLDAQTRQLADVQAEMGTMREEMTDKDRRIAALTRELADVKRQLVAKELHAEVADARISQLEATLRAHGIDVPPEEA